MLHRVESFQCSAHALLLQPAGSAAAVHRFRCYMAYGVLVPWPGSMSPDCKVDALPLDLQGSPKPLSLDFRSDPSWPLIQTHISIESEWGQRLQQHRCYGFSCGHVWM